MKLGAFELLLNTSVIARKISDPSLCEEERCAVFLQDEEIFSPF